MTDHRPVDLGDQTGTTVLVTGSTGGLGWHTASALAGAGARVVITGRRRAALTEATDRIRASHPHADLDSSVVDLASLSSIHEFAEQAKERWPTIDVLINNAGVMAIPERRRTTDGFETHFGTNHLGHFALTGLLLPLLLAAPAPRVVTVSAVISRRGHLDFENLDYHTGYRPMRAYASSKLANVMFAVELARRSTTTGLISVAVHPGTAMTGIQRHGNRLTRALASTLLESLLGQSPADAARPSLLAATAPDIVSGQFYGPRRRFESRGFPGPLKLPALAMDPAARDRLWETSTQLTGVSYALPDAVTPGREMTELKNSDTTTEAGNVAIVRRFLDQVVNGGHLELIDDLWAENLVWHGGSLGEIHGIDAYKQMMFSQANGAFSAMHITIQDVIAAQDKVVVRFTNSGTQVGQFLGFPATGNRARWLGIGIYTIHAGKIAEAWFGEDILSMLLQLGAISPPPNDREDVPT